MKHVIVGTAGHIDHGKSALVQALTGTDPDRWEEEKRRGITIDLGFAHLDLLPPSGTGGDGLRLGFVDVPGHERFVRNMLAGVGGIDLVLLVIAADESIKPQTREHFDICRLLGIPRGLAVLSKADLVEPDLLELVRLETEEFLKGSFLEGAPIVPVSSKTGAGLDRLKQELGRVAAEVPGKDTSHYFRLPIDRAFVMKGFGTVITGTLVAGSIGKDEEVEVFPGRRRLRVRGIQVHSQRAERAYAGQRTALNLAGVETGELERGMVLTLPGRFQASERVDAELLLLPSARPLKQGARVHFHQGTAERIAEVRFFDREQLRPGQQAFVQLRLSAPVLLLPGDRFVIRQFSPVLTIGGGRVLDAQARKHKRGEAGLLPYWQTLAGEDRGKILEALVARDPRGEVEERELVARTGWREQELRGAVEELVAAGRLRRVAEVPRTVADPARLAELGRQALASLDAFHRKEPLLEGISKGELKEQVFGRAADALFDAVIGELTGRGELVVAGDTVKRAGRTVTLSREEQEAKRVIEQAFAQAGLSVPSVKEVLSKVQVEAKRAQKIVLILVREKALVKVTEELLFHRTALERLPELLRRYKGEKGERLSVPAFKELTGITRKYAIPLLEYLDRRRVTRRVGDERQILV
ncbi:selenocysteine-specific translation elongation factor [Acidobacteriia bacterium AH_259_A11_L15]|nr:selenocysteine-specific translation elongation factor [Acidobacteriia bacterium AH_259_A11_L15]